MAKGMLSGASYNRDARPKKSRQGTGKHSKYSATSRNSARKRYRGQGKWDLKESYKENVERYPLICQMISTITEMNIVGI